MNATTHDALQALGLHDDEAGLVAFLPLIEVAWADGSIQGAERRFILDKAQERLTLDEHGREVLQGWLSWRPSDTTLAHGRRALSELVRRDELPVDLADLAEGVAKAAGGMLGLGAIDAREREVLGRLQDAVARAHEEADTVQGWDEEDDEPDTDIGPSPLLDAVAWTDPQVASDSAMLLEISGDETAWHTLTALEFSIGRSRACDLKIGGDSRVSRRHCRFVRREDVWFVEDHASANGTWVNDDRVSVRRLLGGERIRVGSTLLRFVARGE